jgi:tetratricopeptide (TPR) repeat protein
MKYFFRGVFFIGCVVACIVPVYAEGPAEMLDKGWEEYWLQNFSAADKIFQSILKNGGASREEMAEAKLGRAMIVNYQMPGRNPQKAVSLYAAVIPEIESEDLKAQTMILLARAYGENAATADSALGWLSRVIAEYPESNAAREAVLETAYLRLRSYRLEEVPGIIALLEDDLRTHPSHVYAGTMHGVCGLLALEVQRDFPMAQKHLIAWYDAGIANLSNKPTVLFQIGQISEKMLDDPQTAARYYQLLADNHPTDVRNYISRMAARRLREEAKKK